MVFSYTVLGPLSVRRNPEEVGQCAMAKKGKGPDCPRDSSDKRRWVRKWEEDEHIRVSRGSLNMV